MPNLDHDPQHPTDILGQPIAKGDLVAWGTTWGRSPALCVARIEKIRFVRKPVGSYGARIECAQADAEDYTLSLRPIRSTGDVTWVKKVDGSQYRPYVDGDIPQDELESKLKTVLVVKNVVKLDQNTAAVAREWETGQRT